MTDIIKRISNARTYLLDRLPFLGYLALNLKPKIATARDGVPTAGVTAKGTLYLNEDFINNLTEAELRGVLAHEVLHPALGYFLRVGGRDHKVFNQAHDYAINLLIEDFVKKAKEGERVGRMCDIELPKGVLISQKYVGWSAEEIYEELLKNPQQQVSGGMFEDCLTRGHLADGHGGAPSEATNKAWKRLLAGAAQAHEQKMGRGSLPGQLQLWLDNMLHPKHSWDELLSQYLGEHAGHPDLTYLRPSRRSESAGETLIGRQRRMFPDVTVVWDTSGSMQGEEEKIFAEVGAICEELSLSLRVIIIDAEIHADLEDLDEAQDIAEALAGGAGSDFNPAFTRLHEEGNTSVVLAFTDGYIGVPEEMPPNLQDTVWILTQNGADPTNGRWGSIIWLEGEESR